MKPNAEGEWVEWLDKRDRIQLGGHLDDWLDNGLTMTKALVMGFPPVPFSNDAILVAVEVEVNAVVDKYNAAHPHFIVSSLPRGGFSGGPVISEYRFLLGIMTESLVYNNLAPELGFASVVSIEPLLVLLQDHDIRITDNENILYMIGEPFEE
jgi:hypothetical protein